MAPSRLTVGIAEALGAISTDTGWTVSYSNSNGTSFSRTETLSVGSC